MRYVVVEETLRDDHPQWPNQVVYRLMDVQTGFRSLSFYTNQERAQFFCDRRNS